MTFSRLPHARVAAQHGFYAEAFGTPSIFGNAGLALVQFHVVQISLASFRAVSQKPPVGGHKMATVLTELFRVAPRDLDSLADPELEPKAETSIWLRGLGDLELVALWELLPGAESNGTLMADLLSEPDAEVVLMSVPDNFLQCVRDLPDGDIPGRDAEMAVNG